MIKKLLTLITITLFFSQTYATQHIITNSGNAFVPNNITVNLGDTVIFGLGPTHNARQVSLATYNANDTTLLPGGFDLPLGGGMFIPSTLGDVYYVCTPHVQMFQMKGRITVSQVGVEDHASATLQILQSFADQYIKITASGNYIGIMEVEMMNLSGQVIKSFQFNLNGSDNSTTISVADMPKGVYMIRWTYANVHKAKKIILQ